MARTRGSAKASRSNKRFIHKSCTAGVELLESRVFLSTSNYLYIEVLPTRVVAQSTQPMQYGLAIGDSDQNYFGDETVSLVGSNPGTLSGTTTQPATRLFQNFTFSAPGNYTLIATDDRGDTPVTFSINNVLPPTAADHLVIVQQPTIDPATGGFSVKFQLQDVLGDGVAGNPTDPTSEVRLQPWENTGATFPGGFMGINAMPDAHGFVSFDDIGLTQAGSYKMELDSYTANVSSIVFEVDNLPAWHGASAALPATHLVYSGVSFANGTFALEADLADALGNRMENPALGSTDQFTVVIHSGPDGAVLTDGGGFNPSSPTGGGAVLQGYQVSKPGCYTFEIDDITTGSSAITTPILLSSPDLAALPPSAFQGLHLFAFVSIGNDGALSAQAHFEDAAGDMVPDMMLASANELTAQIDSGPAGAVLNTVTDPNLGEEKSLGENFGFAFVSGYSVSTPGAYTIEIDDAASGDSWISNSVEFISVTPAPPAVPTPTPPVPSPGPVDPVGTDPIVTDPIVFDPIVTPPSGAPVTDVILASATMKQARLASTGAVKADIARAARQGASDLKLIEADLKRLSLFKSDRSLIATTKKDVIGGVTRLAADAAHDVGLVNADTRALVFAQAKAAKSPGNSKLEAIVTADQTKLNAAIATALAAVDADTANLAATVSADLTAIGASAESDGQTQTDITTVKTDLSTAAQAIDSRATAFSTKIGTILTDLGL